MSNINNVIYNNTSYPIGQTEDVELPIDYNKVYDTEEHQIGYYKVTGGYKPLYRRTRELGTLSSGGNKSFNLLIDNLDKITDVRLLRYNSTTVGTIPHTAATVDEMSAQIAFWITRGDPNMITIANTNNRSDFTAVMTIKYTKTTDEVLTEIPKQTIPVIAQKQEDIYSADEQVIGQWIDGKSIYRKVIETTNNPPGYSTLDISGLNIDQVVQTYGNSIRTDNGIMPIPKSYPSTEWAITIDLINTTGIHLYIGTGYTNQNAIAKTVLIIEYTKSTD